MSYSTLSLRATCILASVMVCANINAQSSSKPSRAESAYVSLRYSDAVKYFKDDHRRAVPDKQAALASRIADCYWLMRNYDSAYQWYAALSSASFQSDAKAAARLADLHATRGNYTQAAAMAASAPGYEQKAAGFRNSASLKQDSADWQIQYLESVNTKQFREFSPALVQNGLIWSSNLPVKGGKKGVMGWDNQGYTGLMMAADASALASGPIPAHETGASSSAAAGSKNRLAENYDLADFERSRRVVVPAALKAQIQKILAVATPVNMVGGLSFNQAHAVYSATSNQLYFSANRQEKLKNKIRTVGLASSSLSGVVASDVKFIFPDGQDHSLMHPAIQADGSRLVFASDKSGGSGGFDLYVSDRSADGTWSAPRLLSALNTSGNELFPVFGLDGKLYFSSDGRAGLGCLDIYSAEFNGGNAQDIKHLSYPVNSSFDDFGMAVQADGKSGYFTSDRLGSDDIFKFTYERKMVKVSGMVKSEASNKGKQGVDVILESRNDRGSFEKVADTKTNQQGEFIFDAKPGPSYRITYKDGDRVNSTNVPATTAQKGQVRLDDLIFHDMAPPVKPAAEQPVQAPVPVAALMSFTINFDFDSYALKSAAYDALAKVKAAMDSDVSIRCLIRGYTDAAGDHDYNIKLSKLRADAVKKKLVAMGLNASLFFVEALGSTNLLRETNDRSEAEINRRVELKIQ